MIGSFWNLCRACPSMPVDKQLHSEYRSTYRWHEYTGNSRPEVVRRPPAPNSFGPVNEPPLPRRKKCPELAYKSHEFIIGTAEQVHDTRNDAAVVRARSEERVTPSRRSKSEGPPIIANGRAFPVSTENEADGKGRKEISTQAGESSGLFKKTITKLSTEYRLQFVWPHVRKAISGQTNDAKEIPRKSLSMGTIKSSKSIAMPPVHKKRTTIEIEATVYELEPLVSEADKPKTEKHMSPEEKLNGVDTFDHSQRRYMENGQVSDGLHDNKAAVNGWDPYGNQWYKEVIELRKKADEYKCRGWGIEIDPGLYKKQKELWDQVSKRSSLSALSLASSIHRPITKEEKDQENNKKSLPNKKTRVPGHDFLTDNKISDEPLLPTRVQTIRHHLERTTGPDVEEGTLLPSPTREKLMPAIPKSKEVDSYGSQRGSPKKSTASKHGSPQKGSPQKGSPKKIIKGRSQSVGPGVVDANESPKRQLRSISTAPTATLPSKPVKKPPTTAPATTERKPRPSTLSTSTHSRSKSSSLTHSGRTHSAPGNHHIPISQNDTNKTSTTTNLPQTLLNKSNKASRQPRPKSTIANKVTGDMTEPAILSDDRSMNKIQDNKLAESNDENQEKDGPVSVSSSPQPFQDLAEHIVKSPPEPTRVKSPEQIIMRSPDPVNWTVPLDTGKTFTVTQNVKEGESFTRPQSEVKASTPLEKPPPAPQSAPPELAEQEKMKAWHKDDASEKDVSIPQSPSSYSKTVASPGGQFDKAVPGSSQRCVDDPNFDKDSFPSPKNSATEVLEMARDRFDRFWGRNKEENA